jgi:hypothetical protein
MKPDLDRALCLELHEEHNFSHNGIPFGAVTWPYEQNIAPETLLERYGFGARHAIYRVGLICMIWWFEMFLILLSSLKINNWLVCDYDFVVF